MVSALASRAKLDPDQAAAAASELRKLGASEVGDLAELEEGDVKAAAAAAALPKLQANRLVKLRAELLVDGDLPVTMPCFLTAFC